MKFSQAAVMLLLTIGAYPPMLPVERIVILTEEAEHTRQPAMGTAHQKCRRLPTYRGHPAKALQRWHFLLAYRQAVPIAQGVRRSSVEGSVQSQLPSTLNPKP
jgi:hypothetical protein